MTDAKKESARASQEGPFCRDCLESSTSPLRKATNRSGRCSAHYSEYRRYVKRMHARKRSQATRGAGKPVDDPFQPSRLEPAQRPQERFGRLDSEDLIAVLERALDAESEARASLQRGQGDSLRVAIHKLLLSQHELVDALVKRPAQNSNRPDPRP